MKQDDMSKTVYYTDELSDEFSGVKPKNKFIPADYPYIHKNVFYRFFTAIVYRFVLTPAAFLSNNGSLHQKIVNKKILRPFRKSGYFLYGNHTNMLGDGFTPSLVCFPKRVYILVNSDNVAVKGISTALKMGGALPIPSTISGMPNFLRAIEKRAVQRNVICIYPEAHIWPYYTSVRPFKSVSFKYPVRFGDPAFCFTDCYKKRRFGSKPRMFTYIDGPFYADLSLPEEEQHIDLRDRVYAAMKARADKESTYETIHYVKKKPKAVGK